MTDSYDRGPVIDPTTGYASIPHDVVGGEGGHQRVLGAPKAQTAQAIANDDPFAANSQFRVGTDITVLLDEVLNNSIRSILIYDNFRDDGITDSDICALAIVARYNTSLLAININGVDVDDHSISLLCEALVHSRVRMIDFTNTFFDEKAGMALLSLAQCNPNVRTIIIDDTLISEEIADEIDMVCQYNDTTYPLPKPAPILPFRRRYCVQHVFGVCPNGDYCVASHSPLEATGVNLEEGGASAKYGGGGPRGKRRLAPAAAASLAGAASAPTPLPGADGPQAVYTVGGGETGAEASGDDDDNDGQPAPPARAPPAAARPTVTAPTASPVPPPPVAPPPPPSAGYYNVSPMSVAVASMLVAAAAVLLVKPWKA